jgi:hypothetical protein
MGFPDTHPLCMWLYFGAFGSAGIILITLIAWNWMKYHALARGYARSAARWNMVGYMFLFFAAWFA